MPKGSDPTSDYLPDVGPDPRDFSWSWPAIGHCSRGLGAENVLMHKLAALALGLAGLGLGYLLGSRQSDAPDTSAPQRNFRADFGPIKVKEGEILKFEEPQASQAAQLLSAHDGLYSLSPAEQIHAIILLEELAPFEKRDIPGFEISAYADRYISALHLQTSHLLRKADPARQANYQRLHEALDQLNLAEVNFESEFVGGTGASRDRRVEHMDVAKALSKWALRITEGTHPTNPSPGESLKALRAKLAQPVELDADIILPDRLAATQQNTRAARATMIKLLDQVAVELANWPPETAEDLAPLLLKTL